MPLGELRKKKLSHMFTTYFDVNKDGVIEKSDIDTILGKIKERRKWSDDSAEYKQAQEVSNNLWDELSKLDKDKDGKVSIDEWYALYEGTNMQSELNMFQKLSMEFMFRLHDRTNDGEVSAEEWCQIYCQYGFTKDQCKSCYNKLTNNGAIKLDKPTFQKLYKEYFFSDDPKSPGNHLFNCCA